MSNLYLKQVYCQWKSLTAFNDQRGTFIFWLTIKNWLCWNSKLQVKTLESVVWICVLCELTFRNTWILLYDLMTKRRRGVKGGFKSRKTTHKLKKNIKNLHTAVDIKSNLGSVSVYCSSLLITYKPYLVISPKTA